MSIMSHVSNALALEQQSGQLVTLEQQQQQLHQRSSIHSVEFEDLDAFTVSADLPRGSDMSCVAPRPALMGLTVTVTADVIGDHKVPGRSNSQLGGVAATSSPPSSLPSSTLDKSQHGGTPRASASTPSLLGRSTSGVANAPPGVEKKLSGIAEMHTATSAMMDQAMVTGGAAAVVVGSAAETCWHEVTAYGVLDSATGM